jgi:hypothetical protein
LTLSYAEFNGGDDGVAYYHEHSKLNDPYVATSFLKLENYFFQTQLNSQFNSQEVDDAPPCSCGKLGSVYTEKGPLAHNTKCIFWSNAVHSTKEG